MDELPGAFFDSVRGAFGGSLRQSQVDGMNATALAWKKWLAANEDMPAQPEWLAYAFATEFWETGRQMIPVEEVGKGKGKLYGVPDPTSGKVYYGRGKIQLTWRANYEVQGARTGVDLVNEPERALEPLLASDIMLNGMAHGQFTGRRLGQYFTPKISDPVGARRIINGQDRATEIAGYFGIFLAGLSKIC